ncbi:MAG: hypothetical protein KDK27_09635, partial [Leptospiraceae bacterium]|nr:hypothetical protein [Leptospiraceae bacterium]
MRDYLIDFFNLAYLSLQQPAELPVFLGRMRRVTVHIMILLTLAALSVAVGTFHLRDFYNASFIIFIPL